MADAGVMEIAMLAMAAYSVSQSAMASKPKMEMPKEPNMPKAPTDPAIDLSTQSAMAQKQAETAAGTIFSPNPGESGGRVSNDPLTPRKTLLGN